MSEEDTDYLSHVEHLLDLNVAACHLKKKEYRKCIDSCKMVIKLNELNLN